MCFNPVFFVVEGCWCKIEHHTSIFGFCAAASPKCPYKKKVQRLSNYKLEIWKQHRSLSSKLPVTMSGWVPHCKTSRCQHWCTWTNGWAQWHLKSLQKLHIAIEIGWNPKLVNQKMTQKKLKIWENLWNTITAISGIVNSTPIRFVVSSSLGHICYQDTERRLWATWKHDLTHGRPWTAMRSWMLSPPDPKHQGQHLAARRSIFANHLGVCWFVDLRSIWILIKLD